MPRQVVSFLRGFELFGFLIHMLEQIVADMVPFFVIFVVITVGAPAAVDGGARCHAVL